MESPFVLCLQNHQKAKELFADCDSKEKIYQKIIELGKTLPSISDKYKTSAYLVAGCQSNVYLHAELINKKIYFTAYSEALISSGLAAILIYAYQGQPPEAILKVPPTFLQELSISTSLSPGRSNGLASMYRQMQRLVLKFLM